MAYPLIGIKRHELKIGRANYLATCPLKYSPAVFISQVAFWYTFIKSRLQCQRNQKQYGGHVGIHRRNGLKKRN